MLYLKIIVIHLFENMFEGLLGKSLIIMLCGIGIFSMGCYLLSNKIEFHKVEISYNKNSNSLNKNKNNIETINVNDNKDSIHLNKEKDYKISEGGVKDLNIGVLQYIFSGIMLLCGVLTFISGMLFFRNFTLYGNRGY